ncbi:MAG: serpin family protein [Clostridia bacterium]|nr:serpin family protein [Clostridia bacterium]
MKKTVKGMIRTALAVIMLAAVAAEVMGCTPEVKANDLMSGIEPAKKEEIVFDFASSSKKAADFAVRLFKAGYENGENVLMSPLSVMSALAMTANGAKGDTRSQMEEVLGMSVEELNDFFTQYIPKLKNDDTTNIDIANSIWFTDDPRFTVNEAFLQKNADHFAADIYRAPFDGTTLRDINNWVKLKTHGMIPEILDKIDRDSAVMYLVNALAFEAEWPSVYRSTDVWKGDFTAEDGTKTSVDFMHGSESRFIADDLAKGFIKPYKGGKYAFAALLPNEGVSISDYIASLDGGKLLAMLSDPVETKVQTAIPKFETKYSSNMADLLASMGMPLAFDTFGADFTDLGTSTAGNIYINRVLHKTFIEVGERGTRAGAATVVEMNDSAMFIEDIKEVILDRPFVYMLIDCETNLPFFIGALTDVGK